MVASMNVGNLVVKLNGDASNYQKMLAGASKRLKEFGTFMTMYVTTPLSIVGGMAVREFAKFDEAMTESLAIMTATTEQAARMREQALSLAKEGAKGPDEIARSYFYLASAGLDAEQQMKVLPTLMEFATAGAFDMAAATEMLMDSQAALGLKVADANQNMLNAARIADVLTKANVISNASVEQFAKSLTTKAASAMKTFGIQVEEGVAVLAAFADQGIKGELAGNEFARVLTLLSAASQKNQEAFRKYNFSLYTAEGRLRPLADIIQNLEEALGGMSAMEKSAALEAMGFEARVQGAILPLLGTSDAIRKYYQELKNASGYTQSVAIKQMESLSWQLKNLWNNIKVAAIGIGQDLAPRIRELSTYVKGLLESWQALDSGTRKLIINTALFVAALGPAALGLMAVVKAASLLATAYAAVVAGTAAASVGIAALVGVLVYFAATAITNAIYGVDEFNAKMKEMATNHAKYMQQMAKQRGEALAEIGEIKDPQEKNAAIAEERARAKKQMDEARRNAQRAMTQVQVANASVGWYRSEGDDQNIAAAEAEAERAQAEYDAALEYYRSIRDLQDEQVKAEEERTKAAEGLELARINEIKTGIDDLNKELRKSAATMGMSTEEAARWQLAQDGATDAMLAETDALIKQNKALERTNELAKKGKDLMSQYLSPLEKRTKREGELITMFMIGAINRKTYDEALKASNKEYLDDMRERARIEQQFRNDKYLANKLVTEGSDEMYNLMQLVPNAYKPGTPPAPASTAGTSLADLGKIEDQQYQVLRDIRDDARRRPSLTVVSSGAEID